MNPKINPLNQVRQLGAPARLALFLCCLVLFWLPIAVPVFLIYGKESELLLGIWLYGLFIWLIRFWGKQVEQQPRPYEHYGLRFDSRSVKDLSLGVGAGLVSLFMLMQVQVLLGWLEWQDFLNLVDHVLPGLGVALGVSIAEELLFRGWLLTELDRDYEFTRALWVSSLIFAGLHFLNWDVIRNNWAQFPGLVLLGRNLTLARKWSRGGLGLPIGLHCGLVWGYYLIDGADLILPTDRVSEIFTGFNGNPLAGIMGVLFLLAMGQLIKLNPSFK